MGNVIVEKRCENPFWGNNTEVLYCKYCCCPGKLIIREYETSESKKSVLQNKDPKKASIYLQGAIKIKSLYVEVDVISNYVKKATLIILS